MAETHTSESADSNERLAATVFWIVVASAAVLYYVMGRHQWFFYDEWDFLAGRTAFNLHDLFRPHNEHWSTIPILSYRALWWVFGLKTYRPYQIVTILLHLSVGALLRVVMRRSGVRPWIATAAASLFVLLGSGAQDIIWAFQVGYVGAIFFGLIQLLLANHDGDLDRRDYYGLAAGIAALMCSGVAVTLVIVVAIATVLRRGWRIAAFHVVPLATLYLVWWFAIGHQTYVDHKSGLGDDLTFLRHGTSAAFGGMGQLPGVGVALGVMLVVGFAVAIVGDPQSVRRRLSMPLALLVGAYVYLAISSVGRPGLIFSGANRYIHVFVALAIPAIVVAADAIAQRWRVLLPAVVAVLLVGVPGNIAALRVHHFLEDGSRFILTVPRVPVATEVPRNVHPEPILSYDVTVGWLLDGVASGRIPAPVPNAEQRALATLALSVGQVDDDTTRSHCGTPGVQTVYRLARGQRVTFRGGAVRVVVVTRPHAEITFDPSRGRTLVVRAAVAVAFVSSNSHQVVTVCD